MIETVQPHPHTARIEQEIRNQPAYRLKNVYNNRADGKLKARSEVVASILRANKMKPMDVYSKIGITSKKWEPIRQGFPMDKEVMLKIADILKTDLKTITY